MEQRDFWGGFAAGAATAITSALFIGELRRGGKSRILRLEKSVQIAAAQSEVFELWNNLEQLASLTSVIDRVRASGNRSHWHANVNGFPVEWDAEITQIIPNQAIGWKSVTGPKHSGRITFSRLGGDTLVHVQMNYVPPFRLLRRALSPFSGDLEGYIEQALREIKSQLESRQSSVRSQQARQDDLGHAAGSYGPGPELITARQNTRFGAPATPVEYTAPPEAKR